MYVHVGDAHVYVYVHIKSCIKDMIVFTLAKMSFTCIHVSYIYM